MPNKKTATKISKTAKTNQTNGGETHQQATTDLLLTTQPGFAHFRQPEFIERRRPRAQAA